MAVVRSGVVEVLVGEVELLVIDAESITEDVLEDGCIAIASRVFVKSGGGEVGGGGNHSIVKLWRGDELGRRNRKYRHGKGDPKS